MRQRHLRRGKEQSAVQKQDQRQLAEGQRLNSTKYWCSVLKALWAREG
jgi:hypothetical protein